MARPIRIRNQAPPEPGGAPAYRKMRAPLPKDYRTGPLPTPFIMGTLLKSLVAGFFPLVLAYQGQFAAGAGEAVARQPGWRSHPGLRVALAQLPIEDGNLEQNMRLAADAAREAARQHVDLLNLPEAADRGWLYQQARRDALSDPGEVHRLAGGPGPAAVICGFRPDASNATARRSITRRSSSTAPGGSSSSTARSIPSSR